MRKMNRPEDYWTDANYNIVVRNANKAYEGSLALANAYPNLPQHTIEALYALYEASPMENQAIGMDIITDCAKALDTANMLERNGFDNLADYEAYQAEKLAELKLEAEIEDDNLTAIGEAELEAERDFNLLFPIPVIATEVQNTRINAHGEPCTEAEYAAFNLAAEQAEIDAYNEWQLNALESQTPE